MSAHRLDFAGLDLVNADGGGSFWFETLANGFALGSPQAVKFIVASLMRDGSLSRIDRYDNRTITFTVQICGPDLGALADGEAALSLVVVGAARQQLAWTPPDGFGYPTVFEVLNATMDPQADDLAEIRPGIKRRTYALTLECEPFGHSLDLATQTLTPSAVAPTVVDDCSTTADWSKVDPGAIGSISATTVSGETVVTFPLNNPSTATPFDVAWSGTKPVTTYVVIDVRQGTGSTPGQINGFMLDASGNPVPPAVTETVVLSSRNYRRLYFTNPGGTAPYKFRFTTSDPSSTAAITSLSSADTIGIAGVMAVDTLGSVRSVGSVTCSRPGTPITSLFLYADPSLIAGFSPNAQAAWGNGRDGTYVLYAANTYVAGDVVSVSFTDSEGRVVSTLPTRIDTEVAAMSWQPLGQVHLGGFQSGLIGAQTLAVTKNGAAATTPDLRLFRLADDTTLTVLDGISGETVTVQAPSVDYPVGGIWADGVSVAPVWPGFPTVAVPSTALFAEANDSDTSPMTSTLTYFPRSHTYSAV